MFSLFFFRKYSVYMILHIVCIRCKLAITCYAIIVIHMPTVQRLDLSCVRFTHHFPRCNVFISSSPCYSSNSFLSICFALAFFDFHSLSIYLRAYANHHRLHQFNLRRRIPDSYPHLLCTTPVFPLGAVDFAKWSLFTIAHLIYSKPGQWEPKGLHAACIYGATAITKIIGKLERGGNQSG